MEQEKSTDQQVYLWRLTHAKMKKNKALARKKLHRPNMSLAEMYDRAADGFLKDLEDK